MKEGKGSGGNLFDDGSENNTENWTVYQMIRSPELFGSLHCTLVQYMSMYAQDIFFRSKYRVYFRSHLDDIYDLAWSPCSNYLLSGRW